ncbi:MAG TPA: sigma-70 family RNA polymerase sigma factor [Caldithrix abyssi]|uniref:Sigma-70 family RNA polymerase sigma factor n=1 Tax=Caldithrix abyssi TaxID=187145 RepID=A0A7V5RNT2_CALAY|nr:sigma-70 family RNA polymerase sigma factor [Caldithrix abyssi]
MTCKGWKLNEQEIIERAKKGDPHAQSLLVNQYSKRVYNLALRILRNREEAEDVLQETFLTVINKLDTFDGRSSFFTWVYRIATNAALMLLRKKKIRRANFRDNDLDPEQMYLSNVVDWSQDPTARIENTEIKQRIDEALATLKEKYKTVFVLRDIEGLSTRETAEILDISEENVKIRLLRARQALRNYLSQYYEERVDG